MNTQTPIDYGRSNVAPVLTEDDAPAVHLGAFLAEPVFMVASYLGPRYGVASADATADWEQAIDRWAEHMADDGNAAVLRIDLASGTVADVTKDARRDYLKSLRDARMLEPDWVAE